MDLTLKATRDAFGDTLTELASENKNIVALTADLADSLRLTKFKELYPERFFDLGVAEQNLMGISAGLALDGQIPFAASFAVFNPGRNWDQLRVSVCYNNANVKIIGGYVGFSNGKDGATHQALEDIAITRVLPNLVVLDTADYDQTVLAVKEITKYVGPVYLRIRRDPIESVAGVISRIKENSNDYVLPEKKFKIGGSELLKNGNDVTIFACGAMIQKALEAAHKLDQEDIQARVINLYSIKPVDKDIILKAAKETGACVSVEEHQIYGGLGSAIAEVIIQENPVPMRIVAVEDKFGETGTQEELLSSRGLTIENIVSNVKEILRLKK